MQKTYTRLTFELGDGLSLWVRKRARKTGLKRTEILRRVFAMFRAMDEEKLTADQRELVEAARNDQILKDLRFLTGRSVSVAHYEM